MAGHNGPGYPKCSDWGGGGFHSPPGSGVLSWHSQPPFAPLPPPPSACHSPRVQASVGVLGWGRGQLWSMDKRYTCRVASGRQSEVLTGLGTGAADHGCRPLVGLPQVRPEGLCLRTDICRPHPCPMSHMSLQKTCRPPQPGGLLPGRPCSVAQVVPYAKPAWGESQLRLPPHKPCLLTCGLLAWKKKDFDFCLKSQLPDRVLCTHPEEHLFQIHVKARNRPTGFCPHPPFPKPFLEPFGNNLSQAWYHQSKRKKILTQLAKQQSHFKKGKKEEVLKRGVSRVISDNSWERTLELPTLCTQLFLLSQLCLQAEPLRVKRWLPGLQTSHLPNILETRLLTT